MTYGRQYDPKPNAKNYARQIFTTWGCEGQLSNRYAVNKNAEPHKGHDRAQDTKLFVAGNSHHKEQRTERKACRHNCPPHLQHISVQLPKPRDERSISGRYRKPKSLCWFLCAVLVNYLADSL